MNPSFPRSVVCCLRQIHHYLDLLRSDPDLAGVAFEPAGLPNLEALTAITIKPGIGEGLHEYLDHIQIELQRLASAIARSFFGAAAVPSADQAP